MIRLERVADEGEGGARDFAQDLIRFGRSDGNEMVIAEAHVSAEHASIVFDGRAYLLRDHHSTNGTRIRRGSSLLDLGDAPGRELALSGGDQIEIGDVEHPVRFRVQLEEEPDEARIVSMRHVADLDRVEARMGND
ncbi:MAG: FHA domain-containing protein, partial [Myxococcota bacterium]